ncbi:PREDICTED: endothelial protein C receptor [Gekko japonicus]|uniref:Endothelial protein C receptor n=1 Tax=Gekko japonicus TaxID=146911 RepID=A0ABM1JLL7_GEKJA|nr:PREDICTED: endothelial protein C receptor [Gekko japonicus]
MSVLLLPLLPWLLCHQAYGADLHAINMLHLSYFPDNCSVEVVGNATLDGKLTHTLEGHNEQLNVSQLLPLEPSHLWTQRKSNVYQYIQQFQDMVKVIARERHVEYPFHVHCIQGCLIFHNSTSHSFYEVALNGRPFLKFYAANATWLPLKASHMASYATGQLNYYNETTKTLQFFLQETCVKFVKEHSDVNQPLTGERHGRSHTPLVLGIIVGAFALLGLAVCIFLCTGGKR